MALPSKLGLLRWLARGSLHKSPQRTARLWYLLQRLYGDDRPWCDELPHKWTYPELRDRLFAKLHPKGDDLAAAAVRGCPDPGCVCKVSIRELLQLTDAEVRDLLAEEAAAVLKAAAFDTVHNSVRQDLKILTERGWLKKQGATFACVPSSRWPRVMGAENTLTVLREHRDLVQALSTLSFVFPGLEPVLAQLTEPTTSRVFLQMDYALDEETQERVNDYQEILEEAWQQGGQPIAFTYSFGEKGQLRREVEVVVYPVCLHYVVRAKYLSAYGRDPEGEMAWHNYRLDRILSQIKVLAWDDREVPADLQALRADKRLPTVEAVRAALDEAWGFRFYAPKRWLLLRFPADFAEHYVRHTQRHPTFCEIPYGRILREAPPAERARLQALLPQRSPKDVYFAAWVREGDINIVQRMRMWRPNGEVLAPLGLREQMAQEARQEIQTYEDAKSDGKLR